MFLSHAWNQQSTETVPELAAGTAALHWSETSLHPDLLPALANLIIKASERSQVWVVTHSSTLAESLMKGSEAHLIELEKELGQTQVKGSNFV